MHLLLYLLKDPHRLPVDRGIGVRSGPRGRLVGEPHGESGRATCQARTEMARGRAVARRDGGATRRFFPEICRVSRETALGAGSPVY